MRAWRVYGFDDLRLDEIPPQRVRPGWVRVKVRVFQPSVTEALGLKGQLASEGEFIRRKVLEEAPVQLFGHEFCGEVVELGDGVSEFTIGDRVSARGKLPCRECSLCLNGQEDYCWQGPTIGLHIPGCFAEELVVPSYALVRLPPGVDDYAGACVQPLSSVVASVASASPASRPIVAVIGLGVMGLLCVQAVRALSPRMVIGISRRVEARDVALQLGADAVESPESPDLDEHVNRAAGGRAADLVFECSGNPSAAGAAPSPAVEAALRIVAGRGEIVDVATYAHPLQINVSAFRRKSVRYVFSRLATQAHAEESAGLLAGGRVRVDLLLAPCLRGLESFPLALASTLDRDGGRRVGPVQVRV